MSIARLETRLKLIQAALEKPQTTKLRNIRTFTLANGGDIHPPDQRTWKILSMEIAHANGTASIAYIYRYKGTAVHDFYYYKILAASDPNREQCNLYSSELLLDSLTHINFSGGLTAYLFVTVEETDLSIIMS